MRARRGAALLVVGAALLCLPDSQTAPMVFNLVEVEESTGVDFGNDDVVVVLALGSDSRTDDMMEGNADAIELIALDFETGDAAAVGIPRDTLVEYDGVPRKINDGLPRGGPDLMASKVAEITGVTPDYVLTTGFAGFEALVDSIGHLSVHSDLAVVDENYDLHVEPGPNQMNGLQSLGFARTRELPGNDFDRIADHQHLLQAILDKLRAEEDTPGFMEKGALAALQHLDTTLSPIELYRFAQAISQIDPARTTTCVLTGPTNEDDPDVGNVVVLDLAHAQQVAADAVGDGHLAPGTCRG
jgi:LCP family protein required for cell wall assembly